MGKDVLHEIMKPLMTPSLLMLPLLALILVSPGCAFYIKQYRSHISIDGKNYRGRKGDEGGFYVDDEPLVRMHMGCFEQTKLGETVFPLVPLPILIEKEPHASISEESFGFALSHSISHDLALSDLPVSLSINGIEQPLRFAQQAVVEYRSRYWFTSPVVCGDIIDAELKMTLPGDKVRTYRLTFDEAVRRRVRYHTGLVT